MQNTGSSAGGLAVYLHADYIKDQWLGPKVKNYLALPDSGFFMDYEGEGKYDSCMKWLYEQQNTSIALNKKCLADYEPNGLSWKCMFAAVLAPYIESDMLALQSRFDSYQLGSELGAPDNEKDLDCNIYGQNLTDVFMNEYINKVPKRAIHAGFLDSCHHHTGHWNEIVIDGYNSSDAQVDTWFKNTTRKLWFQDRLYPCDSCCTS